MKDYKEKSGYLHITAVRNLTSGQRQQLEAEFIAMRRLELRWETIAFHNGETVNEFEKNFPLIFRPMFFRNLYVWFYMFRNRRNYRFILQRHMAFDPFALVFSWFISNRITIHHSKEMEELKLVKAGWKGRLAALVECISGRVSAVNAKAIIGVTPEIARYQSEVHNLKKRSFFYPNGICLDSISLLEDRRITGELHIAFVCGFFSSWHGLDLLVEAAKEVKSPPYKIFVHVIGNLTSDQEKILDATVTDVDFIHYGYLSKGEYLEVLSKCDVGLGSLALFRKNLTEAVTLKVREYLAMGLPVVASGNKDSALPEDFIYFQDVGISNIFEKLYEIKLLNSSRLDVRQASVKYVDKGYWIKNLLTELDDL